MLCRDSDGASLRDGMLTDAASGQSPGTLGRE